MQISVSGQHLDIGTSLKSYVEKRLNEIVQKYFDHATSAHINFSKQNYSFTCDIVVNDGTGRNMVIKSNSAGEEIYLSFDIAVSKIEKQLRRYKEKIKNHNKTKISEINTDGDAMKYIISTFDPNHDNDETKTDIDNPVIVAEKPTTIKTLSVGEAVMKMDLENLPALMFKNIKTDRVNIVYYRKDGNISWVDSK